MKKFFRCICLIVICACLAGCSSPYAEFLSHYQQTYGTVPQDVYQLNYAEAVLIEITSYHDFVDGTLSYMCREGAGQYALICAKKTESTHYYPNDPAGDRDPFTWTEMEITKVLDQGNYCEDFDELEPGDSITVFERYSFEPDGAVVLGGSAETELIFFTGTEYVMLVWRFSKGFTERLAVGQPSGIFRTEFSYPVDQNTINLTTKQEMDDLQRQDPRYSTGRADLMLDMLRLYRESLAQKD